MVERCEDCGKAIVIQTYERINCDGCDRADKNCPPDVITSREIKCPKCGEPQTICDLREKTKDKMA